MLNFTDTLYVDAAPAQVFGILDDLQQMPHWISRCTRVDEVTEGPNIVGTRFRYHYKQGQREGSMECSIVAREPDSHLRFRFVDQMMVVTIDLSTVAGPADATNVIHTITIAPKGFGRFLTPLIKRRLPGRTTDAATQLRTLVESASAG